MSNNNKATFYNESKIKKRNNKAKNTVEQTLCSETSLTSSEGLDTSHDEILDRNINAGCIGNEPEEETNVPEGGAMASEGFNFKGNNSKNQTDSSWLTMKLCNNNLLSKLADYETAQRPGQEYTDKFWDSVATNHPKIEVEENSKILTNSSVPNQQNKEEIASHKFSDEDKENACSTTKEVDLDYEFAMAAAAGPVYSPPNNSNHTSLNNSTENLSYEDMLLLENDAAESETSINSDDCVYAYRGNADELEFAILNTRKVKGPDDETEFLEMDYEPDPLSEVEYADSNSARADLLQPHSNALLLQRDSCHINSNGRQSAISLRHTPTMGQRLLSSPTEDLPAPINSLQTQAMLSKNFARINLHLDQIKNDPNECNAFDLENLKSNANDNHLSAASALSLPSTLQTSGDESNQNEDTQEYAKITGAKPKRLSRFSSTSSTSSKASTKSRNSLKSSLVPVQGGGDAAGPSTSSMKFDERSVSCNDFRSAPLVSNNSTFQRRSHDSFGDQSSNDDNCLDCLEQEFLANTIGNKDDTSKNCSKCRKHRKNNDNNVIQPNTKNQNIVDYRCRSDSPNYFLEYDYPRDEIYFDEYSPYTCIQYIGPERNIYAFDDEIDVDFEPFRVGSIENGLINQRRRRDKLKKEQMLKNLTMTESEIKVSTLNLSEEVLVQALDKLQVSYNADLIKMYFKNLLFTKLPHNAKCFKNLYQFILYESKKPHNHPKLKRLIETATKGQVSVEFMKDPNLKHQEMTSIKVSDILAQWAKNKNLDVLKHFDKRFMETNVIGKVGNIIRQAQPHRSLHRRPLPEFISVPQFYPSGYLILTKKC